ncbi:LmbE-like protein [Phlebopus sp. FC_14]|nr:LmbE-like protein [Phlebopus sp. FC_14]
MVAWLFALLALLASSLYLPVHSNVQALVGNALGHSPHQHTSRILLLTAHPDDECFFFAPTILALQQDTSNPELFSLCLSIGNADGLGELRKAELHRSLDVMGIGHNKRWVVDHPMLQDNMTANWDASVIAQVVAPYVVDNHITTILTFDKQGISSHPNHYSLHYGAYQLINSMSLKASTPSSIPRVFSLVTVPVFPKYVGIVSALLARLDILLARALVSFASSNLPPSLPVFTSGFKEYVTAARAIRQHDSQLVWFRYLYMAFSRYMWVNEWMEVEPNVM